MKNFSIRMAPEDRKEVSKVASANGLTDGDVIRRAVRYYLKSLRRRKSAVLSN